MSLFRVLTPLVLLLFTAISNGGESIDKVLDVNADGSVSIESVNGNVKIIGWDKAQVAVKGRLDKQAKGYEFQTEAGFTVFKVLMPHSKGRNKFSGGNGSKLTIHVPVQSKVEFESINGRVSIEKVSGGVNAHSVNGKVIGDGLKNRVMLKTVNGNIEASNLDGKIKLATLNGKVKAEKIAGRVNFETINGSIYAHSVARQVNARNVNGSLELTLTEAEEIEVTTVNGDVGLDVTLLEDTHLVATSVGGSIDLSVGGQLGGDFKLNTHAGGDIRNRLTDDEVLRHRFAPGKSLRFELAGGDAKVDVTSVSGQLSIKGQ